MIRLKLLQKDRILCADAGKDVSMTLFDVLTLIGGLIPSRKAAKSDPVTALRTE